MQESGSVFSCAQNTGNCYIESLPLLLKDKRSCFSEGKISAVQLPRLRSGSRALIDVWKPSIASDIIMMLLSMGTSYWDFSAIMGSTAVVYWSLYSYVPNTL